MTIKLNIKGKNAVVEGDDNDLIGQLIKGCKGNISINTPFEKRKVKIVAKHTEPKPKKTKASK